MYKHMENIWTYYYISKLSHFVSTINARVNRVTMLAPNKVTKNHEPHLRSQLCTFGKSKISKVVANQLPLQAKIVENNHLQHANFLENTVSD